MVRYDAINSEIHFEDDKNAIATAEKCRHFSQRFSVSAVRLIKAKRQTALAESSLNVFHLAKEHFPSWN